MGSAPSLCVYTQVPEWKKSSFATHSYGFRQRANMTIKQQRESLPIFKLRQELVDAVAAHQARHF